MSHTEMQFLLLRDQTVHYKDQPLDATVYCLSHTKHKYSMWRNEEFCNVTAGGTYSYR